MIEAVTDPSVLEGYLTDASNIRGYAEALVRPETAEQVAEVLRHCQAHGIPVTVTAGRTSTTAGPVPFGGWLLSTEKLGQILHIGHDTATAQGGVFLGAFQQAIEATGRFFPPDPTSRHECTLGAAIACNASGARSFRYGPTRPWVQALQVVTPTGEILQVQRGDPPPVGWRLPAWHEPAVKTAAGYAPAKDAVDVFIGQEGTLGILTEATVRLTDLPEQVLGIVAWFRDRDTALDAMEALRRSARADARGALSPRALEYLDAACVDLARLRVPDVPAEARAALFCEQEVVPEVGDDAHLAAWWGLLEETGALVDETVVTTDDAGQEKLRAVRHAIPAGINERVIKNGMPKVGTDLSVPDDALRTMMDLYEQAPIEHVLFGHLGDNHLHLNMLPRTHEELQTARAYYRTLSQQAVALGGSVSAEHGIGKIKKDYLAMMVQPSVLQAFRALKRQVDPAWILGRGVLFDPDPDAAL